MDSQTALVLDTAAQVIEKLAGNTRLGWPDTARDTSIALEKFAFAANVAGAKQDYLDRIARVSAAIRDNAPACVECGGDTTGFGGVYVPHAGDCSERR
jgi:hypothetical protein